MSSQQPKTYDCTILEHTADMKLRAQGGDFPSTLRSLACGLFDVLFGPVGDVLGQTHHLEVEAWDRASLVVNLLNEILYLVEVHSFRPIDLQVSEVTDAGLIASLQWERAEQPPHYEIKAATYHGLLVSDGMVEVVFDL